MSHTDTDTDTDTEFEYQIRWSASTNINFKGSSDWIAYDGFTENLSEVEDELNQPGAISDILHEVLLEAGFEWEVEVREVSA